MIAGVAVEPVPSMWDVRLSAHSVLATWCTSATVGTLMSVL